MSLECDFEDIALTQGSKNPKPKTLTTSTTIAPTTFLTILSGSTAVATITPPLTGVHHLAFITGTVNNAFTTSGNIVGLTTGNTTQPVLFMYNPISGTYIRYVA